MANSVVFAHLMEEHGKLDQPPGAGFRHTINPAKICVVLLYTLSSKYCRAASEMAGWAGSATEFKPTRPELSCQTSNSHLFGIGFCISCFQPSFLWFFTMYIILQYIFILLPLSTEHFFLALLSTNLYALSFGKYQLESSLQSTRTDYSRYFILPNEKVCDENEKSPL
jgi:hypothetical protein